MCRIYIPPLKPFHVCRQTRECFHLNSRTQEQLKELHHISNAHCARTTIFPTPPAPHPLSSHTPHPLSSHTLTSCIHLLLSHLLLSHLLLSHLPTLSPHTLSHLSPSPHFHTLSPSAGLKLLKHQPSFSSRGEMAMKVID